MPAIPATIPAATRRHAARRSAPPDRRRTPAATLPRNPRRPAGPRIGNRIGVLLAHVPWFSLQGQARLAARAGVSRSTVSRLVRGRTEPSYRLARAVTDALGRQMGRALDMREVFTTDGTYPTPSGCALCGCPGCLPDEAYLPDGSRRPEWKDARPGEWSVAPTSPPPEEPQSGALLTPNLHTEVK